MRDHAEKSKYRWLLALQTQFVTLISPWHLFISNMWIREPWNSRGLQKCHHYVHDYKLGLNTMLFFSIHRISYEPSNDSKLQTVTEFTVKWNGKQPMWRRSEGWRNWLEIFIKAFWTPQEMLFILSCLRKTLKHVAWRIKVQTKQKESSIIN